MKIKDGLIKYINTIKKEKAKKTNRIARNSQPK